MTDQDLQQSLSGLNTPAPSARARDRALHRATIALANPAPAASPRRHHWNLALTALGSACAVALCGWLLLRNTAPPSFTADSDLLAQTGRLFPGQLNAIIISDGTPHLDLSANTTTLPAPDDQAVLVELTRNGHSLRVLGYSGRSVSIELDGSELRFVPLLTATGDILLSGDNFIWSKAQPEKIAGWNVTTQTLAVRL